jgi:gamma-glutamyltranspeptidase / glutathione hydrolase
VLTPRPLGAHRSAALGADGAVTSSHPAVSRLGAQILAEGGNAFDATVAMAALSWLVLPGQCGIGGDAFVLVREPDGRVWTLAGSGFGPDGGTPGYYRDCGLDRLPLSGALSVSVPGAAGVIRHLGERATRSLAELWTPAIRAAETGVPCTPKTLADVTQYAASLADDPGTASVYLPGGGLPRIGDKLCQPDLGRTLRRLADNPADFHVGWFADRALDWLAAQGAPFSGGEWALTAGIPAEPAITTTYGGLLLHETPQPSPGWMVLHQARVLDGQLSNLDQLGAAAIGWFAGAAAASFRYRLEYGGADNDNWRIALGDEAVRRVRQGIGNRQPGAMPGQVGPGDTTTTLCIDAHGTAISFIHSLAFTFGARVTVPGTGVVLNNRLGRGAYLIDGHPNEIRPRRRPMNTLNAWLLSDGDELGALGNCPGGEGEV